MTSLFHKRDAWGHGLSLWILVAVVFSLPLAWSSLSKVDLDNDVENWLPAENPDAKTLAWFEKNFGSEQRILVSWKGSSLTDSRVEKLALRLEGTRDEAGVQRNGLPHIQSVATPNGVIRRMTDQNVDREEAVRRLTGVLVGKGMLKVRLTEAGRKNVQQSMDLLAGQVKAELGLKVDTIKVDELAQLKAAEEAEMRAEEEAAAAEETEEKPTASSASEKSAVPKKYDFEVAWRGMHVRPEQVETVQKVLNSVRAEGRRIIETGKPLVEESFFVPGSPVALSISLSKAGEADSAATLAAIRKAAVEVGIPENELHLGGSIVAGSALNQQVSRAVWNPDYSIVQFHRKSPLLLSALMGAVLSYLVLRSLRLTWIVLGVSMYVTFVTVALVPATGGTMNMVLIVMPTLLMVVTTSGAIHVTNYWRYAAANDQRTAVGKAVEMARMPCILASLTTAFGLASLSTSPLAPVRQFGLYSAVGCLISLAAILLLLPALLQFFPARTPRKIDVEYGGWRYLGDLLSRFRWVVIGCGAMLAVVAGLGLRSFRTETKVIRYFPADSRVVTDYNFLEENLAGIMPIDLVIRFDEDSRQKLNFAERLELIRKIQSRLREHSEISGSLSLADFIPTMEAPEETTGWRRIKYNKQVAETERRVKQENSAVKSFLMTAGESADLTKAGDGKICRKGDELWRISAQVAVMSDNRHDALTSDLSAIIQEELRVHPGAGHLLTGMVPVFLRTQQAVLDSLISSFGLAFLLIMVVMMFLLKNPLAGLFAMIPNVLPIVVVFGLVSTCGMPVDIGTMITASVALGIAVDGTLHLLGWFRGGLLNGLSRQESIRAALAHCGPAMWETSVSIGVALLALWPAELILISRFGWFMSALIGVALLADVVVLPALLAGPLGKLIEGSVAVELRNRAEDQQTLTEPAAAEPPVSHEGKLKIDRPHDSPKPQVLKHPAVTASK